MIVLPLGLPVYDSAIADRINRALQKKIICLAATGNQGANARIAFPARMNGVVAIHSADANGNPSLFNATPLPGRKNFATLGEAIPVKSITSGGAYGVYLSGSTYAVTLAASVLASVITLAKHTLGLEPYAMQIL
jgi:hypothetical protein